VTRFLENGYNVVGNSRGISDSSNLTPSPQLVVLSRLTRLEKSPYKTSNLKCLLSLCWEAAAMMLARRGHSVTIFQSDSDPIPASPEQAWQSWERKGVIQFRLPHFLHSPASRLLDSHLPDVKEALLRAGCITFDRLATMPLSITDRAPREGDERFLTITGRLGCFNRSLGRLRSGF
jgi:hypothetical protein